MAVANYGGLSGTGYGSFMPSMGQLGMGAGLLGVGLGAYNAFTSNPPALNVNIPTNVPQGGFGYDPSQINPTQTNLLGGISNLGQYNIGGQFLPQAGPIAQGMLGNYGAPQYFQGATTAAGYGGGAAMDRDDHERSADASGSAQPRGNVERADRGERERLRSWRSARAVISFMPRRRSRLRS